MSQFNDAKLARLQLSGFIDDHITDAEYSWLLAATEEKGGQYNDLWDVYLTQRGFADGALPERLFDYLGSLGFDTSDQLQDRLHDWWSSTAPMPGPVPPPPP